MRQTDTFDAGPGSRWTSRLPLSLRRRVGIGWRGGVRRGLGLAPLLSRALRLPGREARRLDRAAAAHDLAMEGEWLALHLRSRSGILADCGRVEVDRPDLFARLAESGRPVILAPMHMGAYVLCLAALMFRFFPGRPMLILRQRDDMAMETAVMERIREFGIPMRFLQVSSRRDYLSAVRFAREGAVTVVFCDLSPDYGAPAAMPMFGLPLSFAFGVEALARLTGATVVPMATVASRRGDAVLTGEPFEIVTDDEAERERAVAVTRRHLHRAISSHPEQWHLWARIDDYLPPAVEPPSDHRPSRAA